MSKIWQHRRPIQSSFFAQKGVVPVRHPFLERVEQACKLREGRDTRISWQETIAPFNWHLVVSKDDGGIVRQSPVAALNRTPSEEALSVFIQHVHLPYLKADPATISTIVYGGDPVPQARQEAAIQNRVRLIRFSDYQEVIDFHPYLAWQSQRIERDPSYRSSLYVDQRVIVAEGAEEQLHDNAIDALTELLTAEHPRFILILGDVGMGKTFLLHELTQKLARAGGPLIPLFIELRSLERAYDFDTLIAQHLAYAKMSQIDLAAFRYMLAEGRIVLLFDGFDELAFKVSYSRASEHFDTLIHAVQGKCAKVVVTSRAQHFTTERHARTFLAHKVGALQGYRLMRLQPFTNTQVRSFLTQSIGDQSKVQSLLVLLSRIKDLPALATNPRMLSFIAEIGEEQLQASNEDDEPITSATIYKLLVDKWLVRDHERMHLRQNVDKLTIEQRWHAITRLAIELWQRMERQVSVRELSAEVTEVLRVLGKHELDVHLGNQQAGSATLVVWDERDNFRFVHQSVLEWLVMKEAAEQVRRNGDAPVLARGEMTDRMIDFFADLAGREFAWAWAAAKVATLDQELASKNALRIQRRLRQPVTHRNTFDIHVEVDMSGQDLRGHDFSSADLRQARLQQVNLSYAMLAKANLAEADLDRARLVGADLYRSHLSGARLTGANLTQARMLGADLRGAKLDGATLRRAKLVGAKTPELEHCDTFGAAPPAPTVFEPTWTSASLCTSVAFSSDGQLLASGHSDGSVRIWDVVTSHALRVLKGHTADVTSIVFSQDSKSLASGSQDHNVILWDVETGHIRDVLRHHAQPITDVVFCRDSSNLVCSSADATVTIWNVSTASCLRALKGQSAIVCMAASPDGTMIASASTDESICLWDLTTEHPPSILQCGSNVVHLAFHPSGEFLASALEDQSVVVWNTLSKSMTRVLKGHESRIRCVTFSSDGKTIASASSNNTVIFWHIDSEEPLLRIDDDLGDCVCTAFSPDGRTIASGNGKDFSTTDSSLYYHILVLRDIRSGSMTRIFKEHVGSAVSIAIHPDGFILASASQDKTVTLWNMSSGQALHVLNGRVTIHDVAFSPSGKVLASAFDDNTVTLWDVASAQPLHVLSEHTGPVLCVTFSPDSSIMASGSEDHSILLWDTTSGSIVHRLQGHTDSVHSIAFGGGGQTLISGSRDGTLAIWDTTSAQRLSTMPLVKAETPYCMAFSPDAQLAAIGTLDITLQELATGTTLRVLKGHASPITSVAFSPDGQMLASASLDKTVALWSVTSIHPVRILKGHLDDVVSVAFSPDGALIASGSRDSTIRLWDVVTGVCLALLLKLPEGWVAFTLQGRYCVGGHVGGAFWHAVNLCRFEPGELDDFVPGLRTTAGQPLFNMPTNLPTNMEVTYVPTNSPPRMQSALDDATLSLSGRGSRKGE